MYSLFTPPTRAALEARSYREAMRLNGAGMSKQAFHLMGKIREVDALMQPALQQRIFEAHPEITFAALAGHPMRHTKKTPAGAREREALVAPCFGEHFIEPQAVRKRYPRSQVAQDDVLDAYALAITASRLHGGSAMRLPGSEPERDGRGLSMDMVLNIGGERPCCNVAPSYAVSPKVLGEHFSDTVMAMIGPSSLALPQRSGPEKACVALRVKTIVPFASDM